MVIIINILIIFRPYILYRVTAHLSSYFLRINSKAGIVVQKISKDGALLPLAVSGTSSNMPAFKFSYTFFISQPFGQEQVWYGGFPGGTMVKNPPANEGDSGDVGSIPGLGRSLEEERATHSSIFAWKIPRTEEPGRLQSMGSQSQAQLSN